MTSRPAQPPQLSPERAWQAAGVRHEILMRVLPSVRHDMAGPLSVVRMGNAVLKRYLEADPPDLLASRRRLEQNEAQMQELLVAVQSLGGWDLGSDGLREAAGLVGLALHLARPDLDQRGTQVEANDPAQLMTGWSKLQAARATYSLLGCVFYLQDSATGPSMIRLAASPAGALELSRHATDPKDDAMLAARSLNVDLEARLLINRDALKCLLESLGWHGEIADDAVRLKPPTTA